MLHNVKCLFRKNRCYCEAEIYKEEIEKMLKQGAILLDVRSPQEYNEGHLEHAMLLPTYEIKQKANNILPNKEQIIIVYCNTGNRSKKAQKILTNMGYTKVYNLCNGLENYN